MYFPYILYLLYNYVPFQHSRRACLQQFAGSPNMEIVSPGGIRMKYLSTGQLLLLGVAVGDGCMCPLIEMSFLVR